MSDEQSQSTDREERLDEAVAAYFLAVEADRAPDRQEWLARYPDVAGELEHFFARIERIDRLTAPFRLLATAASGVTHSEGSGGLGRLGDFHLLREVGRGGIGVVYEAEQVSLGRRVALKVLSFAATVDPRHLQRFENEARSAASLHHQNIVPVYAVGCDRGVRFYAMQFVDGRTLAELIAAQRQERLSPSPPQPDIAAPAASTLPAARTSPKAQEATSKGPPDAAYYRRLTEWGVQAAEALEHAHGLGIIHRDVKPGNLMIDGGGKLWVTDFGLARVAADAGLTMSGDMLGTLRYMSPEQALAKHGLVDHRTDVYSLGATLYELATFKPAVSGKDRAEILRRITLEEPTLPCALDRTVPAELEIIVLKAMAKEPQDRYATAQELADDLRRWLDDRAIHARRPSLYQRVRRWMRRHRAAVTAAVAVLLVVVVLGGVNGLWWLQKRAAAEAEARVELREAARLQEEEKWPEALGAVRRARGALAGVWADPALREEVDELGKDLEMARRLQEARLRLADIKDGHDDWEASSKACAEAFAWYGLDVDNLDPQEAGERIRARSISRELAAALDDWANLRRNAGLRGWRHLLAISRLADPDPWRDRLRAGLEGKDPRALKELATSARADELPRATVVLLARLTKGTTAAKETVVVLDQAQKRHPDDF